MTSLLLSTGVISLLPKILLGVLIIALFLGILYLILQKIPSPVVRDWTWTIILVVGGIIVLLWLISLYSGESISETIR